MELLVNYIDLSVQDVWKNVIDISGDNMITEYKLIDKRFHCFKVLKTQPAKKYAVKKDDSLKPLDEVVGDEINFLSLLIFDINKKRIYFNTLKKEMKRIMLEYFKIENDVILTEVSFNELVYLDSIKIIEYAHENLSLFEEDGLTLPQTIDDLAKKNVLDRISIDLKFRVTSENRLYGMNIETLIKKYSTGSKTLTFSGYDKNHNPIKSDETGAFNKKIDIELSVNDYNSINKCEFKTIVSQIKEKING